MSIKWLRHTFVTALIAGAGSALLAAPQVQFEKESLDFGKIAGGQPIDVVFAFKNVGDAELEITGVRPGCGCTRAQARSTKLAPGESSTIEAVFNSTGFNGTISKGITVNTNDPANGAVHLSIRGEVVPLAILRPTLQNFGTLKVNNTYLHTFKVVPTDPKTFAITKVEAQGTHVTNPAFKKVETPAGTNWEVSFTVTAGATPGRVMEKIVLTTNAGETMKLSATVYGNVVE